MRVCAFVACLTAVLGCSSSGGTQKPSGPVTGTVPGDTSTALVPFTAKGTYALRPPIDNCVINGTAQPFLAVYVYFDKYVDSTTLLSDYCVEQGQANGISVGLAIADISPAGDIAPGLYTFGEDVRSWRGVFRARMDASCKQVLPNEIATSGSATLEIIDSNHIVGYLTDVSFPNGGKLSGAFDAPVVASKFSVCEQSGLTGGTPGPGCPAVPCVQP